LPGTSAQEQISPSSSTPRQVAGEGREIAIGLAAAQERLHQFPQSQELNPVPDGATLQRLDLVAEPRQDVCRRFRSRLRQGVQAGKHGLQFLEAAANGAPLDSAGARIAQVPFSEAARLAGRRIRPDFRDRR